MHKLFKLDWILLISVFLIVFIGLLALYSISYEDSTFNPSNLEKQLIAVSIGAAALFFFAFFDYRMLNANSSKLYFLMLIVLLFVILFGKTVRGTTGWIGFSFFSFQPVELAKLIMVIFLGSFLSKKITELGAWTRIIASAVLMLIPVLFILKQPDFGSASVIVGIWAVLLTVSGLSKKSIFILFLLGLATAASSWFFLKSYQRERIMTFVRPEMDPQGSGYNVIQSIVAVGSGGITGKGLGHGSQSQLNFLPEKHTDFIFAVIAEELGFTGTLAIFVLFGMVFWRIKEIAFGARDNFGFLVSVGVLAMFFFQLLVNIGMNIGVMPVAGVPLPFLSYGGSSMITVLASVGIIESIYIRRSEIRISS